MAIISLPSFPKPQSVPDFRLVRADAAIELMNGSEVIINNRKALWSYSFRLPPMEIADARLWSSRLMQLSSFEHTFLASPPHYAGPSTGYAGPPPLVKGAGQLGLTLTCDGVTPSAAIVKEGDFISVNGELKMLTADAVADGSGNVVFAFTPAIRMPAADNAVGNITTPAATFRLLSPSAGFSVEAGMIFGFAVDAIETVSP